MDTSTMLDKVVGHYTVVGTEEATEFLKLCDQLGLKWHSGGGVYECKPLRKYICVYDDGECTLSQGSNTTDLNGLYSKLSELDICSLLDGYGWVTKAITPDGINIDFFDIEYDDANTPYGS